MSQLNLDFSRRKRQGFEEVIFGAGKSEDQLRSICEQYQTKQVPMLVTRVQEKHRELLIKFFPSDECQYYKLAKAFSWKPKDHQNIKIMGRVNLICAGSSDMFVIEETEATLDFFGVEFCHICDVGVAGIHRILGQEKLLHEADVNIVAAGMDGALPSVVGGLVKTPVIAIPTSVGYGASFQGVSALLTMLNSCASGVAVVNIDNGYGAAMSALRILQTKDK